MTKLSPDAEEMLDFARSEFGPTELDRQQLRARIRERAALAASTASHEAGAGSGRSLSGVPSSLRLHGAKWLVGVALVATVFVMKQRASTVGNVVPAPSESTSPPAAMLANGNDSEPLARPTPEPTLSPQLLPDAPSETPSARQRPAAAPLRKSDQSGDSLQEETRILFEAHAALKRGELPRARAQLEAYRQAYPHGVLREERLALSVLVDCAEGKTGNARREAEELARRNPRSSHIKGLRDSCVADVLPPRSPSE